MDGSEHFRLDQGLIDIRTAQTSEERKPMIDELWVRYLDLRHAIEVLADCALKALVKVHSLDVKEKEIEAQRGKEKGNTFLG